MEKYYKLDKILKHDATFNIIIGQRSNGKTYATLKHCIEQCFKNKSQMAIIRRYEDDFKGHRGQFLFDDMVKNGIIKKASKGEWDGVHYVGKKWYFILHDEETGEIVKKSPEPFCFGFAISGMEHDKSVPYPNVYNIVFDEFIARDFYLVNEMSLFTNVLSTIIRHREGVKIFMLGNTVNKHGCPYFQEMGLKHIKDMKEGTIDVYTQGDTGRKIAVERCGQIKTSKKSELYYTFDTPTTDMITQGGWETLQYPHAPKKWKSTDIIFNFFIMYDDIILQCDVIDDGSTTFIFIHEKTTAIKNEDDLIFSDRITEQPNFIRNMLKLKYPIQNKILYYFRNNLIFYQNNEVGELVRSYIMFCKKNA